MTEYLCKGERGEFKLSTELELEIGPVLLLTEDQVTKALTSEVAESIAKDYILKPYPNEHACRHQSPGRYDDFRRTQRQHEGKPYSILWGHDKATGKWEEQAYRYPVDRWSAEQAKAHCEAHGGMSFEPSAPSEKAAPVLVSSILKARVGIVKGTNEEKRLVYGVALEPMSIDTWLDFETPETIEETAHKYLLEYRGVGSEHEKEIKAAPVESFIAPMDFWFEGTPQNDEYLVRKGSWVVVVKVLDAGEWEKVKDGTYTGFSIQGSGVRRPIELLPEIEGEGVGVAT